MLASRRLASYSRNFWHEIRKSLDVALLSTFSRYDIVRYDLKHFDAIVEIMIDRELLSSFHAYYSYA